MSQEKENTLERSKRPNAPKSSVSYSTQGSKSVSLMIDLTISIAYPLCIRRRRVHWVTGPVSVINPLPAPWPGFEGDNVLGCLSPRVTVPFWRWRSSFPLVFLLGAPFSTTLGADEDAPSFPFSFSSFLHVVADTLTNALYLAASISVKDKGRELDIKTTRKRWKEIRKEKTYVDESNYSIYMLQASALDHHNRHAGYLEWSGPCTFVPWMESQEPDE